MLRFFSFILDMALVLKQFCRKNIKGDSCWSTIPVPMKDNVLLYSASDVYFYIYMRLFFLCLQIKLFIYACFETFLYAIKANFYFYRY